MTKTSRWIRRAATSIIGGIAVAAGLMAPAQASPLGAVIPTPHSCTDTVAVVVPGGAQSLPGVPSFISPGTTGAVAKGLNNSGVSVRTVAYKATPFLIDTYRQSADAGLATARNVAARTAAACPSSKIALVGYSEGADIAARLTEEIGDGHGVVPAERFGGATLISNPYNGPASGHKAGSQQHGTGVRGAMDSYGEVGDQVLDICNAGDFVCDSDAVRGSNKLADALIDSSISRGGFPMNAQTAMNTISQTPQLINGAQLHNTSYFRATGAAVGHILANR